MARPRPPASPVADEDQHKRRKGVRVNVDALQGKEKDKFLKCQARREKKIQDGKDLYTTIQKAELERVPDDDLSPGLRQLRSYTVRCDGWPNQRV